MFAHALPLDDGHLLLLPQCWLQGPPAAPPTPLPADSVEIQSQNTTEESQDFNKEENIGRNDDAILEEGSKIRIREYEEIAQRDNGDKNDSTINSSATSTISDEIDSPTTAANANSTSTSKQIDSSNENELEAVDF